MNENNREFYRVFAPGLPNERPVSEGLTEADAERRARKFLTAYPDAGVWTEKTDASGRAIPGSGDAKPRRPCPTCNQSFSSATDRQWRHRWNYHLLFSERHRKYVAVLENAPLAQVVQHKYNLYR